MCKVLWDILPGIHFVVDFFIVMVILVSRIFHIYFVSRKLYLPSHSSLSMHFPLKLLKGLTLHVHPPVHTGRSVKVVFCQAG